ncbi:MAG: lamin tail domain-containing protein, partial [Verrucomicrobiales bacterium]|nr:lamin tail domain-containing protein [Verrucomicrobiales bacterium]
AEVAAGYTDADAFEWVELLNVGERTVELDGVEFGNGIDYVFGAGTLPPGERVVVVRDAGAFGMRNPGVVVAGEFALGLANGGERIELVDRGGVGIMEFSYGDRLPWPEEADGGGYSLTLIGDGDSVEVGSWRPSALPGGTPGGSDVVDWDGDVGLLVYALEGGIEVGGDGGFLVRWVQRTGADDARVVPEVAGALREWSSGGVELVAGRSNGDGTRTMTVRVIDPLVRFLRLRVAER